MAIWEKNPENNKTEKCAFWFARAAGAVFMGSGIYGLYVYVSAAISKKMYLGWLILNFTQSIVAVILGIGLLVYYKKSVHIWSRLSIFIPLIVFLQQFF